MDESTLRFSAALAPRPIPTSQRDAAEEALHLLTIENRTMERIAKRDPRERKISEARRREVDDARKYSCDGR